MPADFLDSNIVLYSLAKDDAKQHRALALLAAEAVISTQVLSEVANVMRRKLGYELEAIRAVLLRLMGTAQLHPVAPSTILLALDIAQRYGFSYYDSQILAAAQEAGCTRVYSEDLQHGQVLASGLTIINPWSASSAGDRN
ncbi:PIN domain-containing protein [Halochromatium glycolicum]|jgi:predicted nucleic acid-binding protein|uniref:Nucleic-acid-binding protein n=1 Tax=Halochromatium glycolicum TaxID=85075 RepID=A0AAJ0XAZ4_9GAMM|nr:PIN domain-containing protein [Halochromatium glycolicum]MBK1705843.1 nucleic-acid-binding protein [Halochromatium glycolicum]